MNEKIKTKDVERACFVRWAQWRQPKRSWSEKILQWLRKILSSLK